MDHALLDRKVVFFAGKGGVGKSTSASAFALCAARQGKRVLLVSTDPAHNLGDIFHAPIGGEGITRVAANLDALEVDAHRETHRYLDGVKENIRRTVSSTMMEEAMRQIDLAAHSPGATEAALFDRMVSLILEESQDYDLLVFDTAPTGHTVRLLTLPELMGTWVDGLLKRRRKRNKDYSHWLGDGEVPDDPLYDVLSRRRQRAAAMRDILLDDSATAFVFVLVPEYLPITETRNAIRELAAWDIHVRHLVVNKLLPADVTDAFFRERLVREERWLDRIDEYFHDLHQVRLPLLPGDVDSREALDQVAAAIEAELSKR